VENTRTGEIEVNRLIINNSIVLPPSPPAPISANCTFDVPETYATIQEAVTAAESQLTSETITSGLISICGTDFAENIAITVGPLFIAGRVGGGGASLTGDLTISRAR
jgi:hypothetical protein